MLGIEIWIYNKFIILLMARKWERLNLLLYLEIKWAQKTFGLFHLKLNLN